MSRTSALTRKPKGLGRRNFAQGYPRSHATPTPTSRSKGQKSRSRGGGILWQSPSRTACLQLCFTRVADMTSRRRLRSSDSHRLDVPPVRLSGRAFLVAGANVWNDLFYSSSHLHSHSRSSDSVSRLSFSLVLTRTSWYDSIVFLSSDISHGPCNNWHYLGHVKHVDDDDDDDEDGCVVVSAAMVVGVLYGDRPAYYTPWPVLTSSAGP